MRWLALVAFTSALAPGLGARSAQAAEWEASFQSRLYGESLSPDLLDSLLRLPGTERDASERLRYQAHLYARGAARPSDVLGLELALDSGLLELGGGEALIDARPIGERVEETLLLGETFADVQLGATGVFELRAGKLRPRIGRGAIFDAYAFGVDVDVDLGLVDDESPWRFHLNALLPDATFTRRGKKNPLLDVEVALESRGGSELRLIGAALFDEDDGLAPVLADAVFRGRITAAVRALEEGQVAREGLAARVARQLRVLSTAYGAGRVGYDLHTSGVLGWLGLLGRLRASPLVVRGTLLAGLGHVDVSAKGFGFEAFGPQCDPARAACRALIQDYESRVSLPTDATRIRLRSILADVTAGLALSDEVALDAFGLVMSGDDGFTKDAWSGVDTYKSFISLAPFLDHSLIFFRGGVAGSLASPLVASVAPDGAGLLAFGGGVTYTPAERVRLRANGALMASTVAGVATRSRALGAEADLVIEAEVAEFLSLSGSAGVFAPGAYYGDLPVGWQAIASATLHAAQL